jgi:UDP-xylose/UDP-N-acetylglucosamine transporter B4
MTVNLLNNSAFAFKISVPLHIILRSGGPVASMLIGYLYNSKIYTRTQVIAVLLLTGGVIGAALADANTRGKSLDIGLGSNSSGSPLVTSLTGFMFLGLSMILSAFQGVYADRLYDAYGRNHWREALFYSHALSLPFLIPSYPQLLPQLQAILSSPPVLSTFSTAIENNDILFSNGTTSILRPGSSGETIEASRSPTSWATSLFLWLPTHPLLQPIFSQTPSKVLYLILNALTQYFCIRGVHLLSAKSSSLTVTIVLNIRKLVSLMVSIYMFGNALATGVLVSAAVVFIAGGIYGFEGARIKKRKEKSS